METIAGKDEWSIVVRLLPAGWQEQAREKQAFRRVRYTQTPEELLRLLLFHAVNHRGLRATVAQARVAGLATMSMVGLFKRLRSSGAWLGWIAAELCRGMREEVRLPAGVRPRVIDSTTLQGPGSQGTEWRLHYALDLRTCACDWHALTDAHGAEALERAPVVAGDVLLADRNFLRPAGVRAVQGAGGHVLVRLRWCHPALLDRRGRKLSALTLARRLRVGAVGDWPAWLADPEGAPIAGRVVALKLPAPLARQAERRAIRRADKKRRQVDPRSLEAAHYVLLFTTLPAPLLDAKGVLELYRFRWQIELVFKRHKQILRLGHLPHKDPRAAQAWILAKLVVALLLEILYRNAVAISPWGYSLEQARPSEAAA
jgi:hypothetical protein